MATDLDTGDTVDPVDTTDTTIITDGNEGGNEGDANADIKPNGNENWRTDWAGADDKLGKFLGRFHSPQAALAKIKEQHDDIRSGKYLKPLPENPTDDEVAAYRGAFGVPDAPDGYLEALPDGLVVGDDDKPFVDKFLEGMHGANAPKGAVGAALSAYYQIVEEQAAAEADQANALKGESIEVLRSEWGADYKRNMNIMHSHLDTMPDAVSDVFRNGKLADGSPIGYNAEVIKWLTGQAMEANPVATVVPGAGSNQASAIADEIATLKAKMGNTNSDYWKGPTSAAQQARYLQLVEAQQKLNS